jgi:hypothetical protein
MLFDFSEVEWVSKKTKQYNGAIEYGARISVQLNGKNVDGSTRWTNCVAFSHRVMQKFDIKEGDKFNIGKIEKAGKVYVVVAKHPEGYKISRAHKGENGTGFVKFAHGAKSKESLPFPKSIEVPVEEVSCFGDAIFFQIPGGEK